MPYPPEWPTETHLKKPRREYLSILFHDVPQEGKRDLRIPVFLNIVPTSSLLEPFVDNGVLWIASSTSLGMRVACGDHVFVFQDNAFYTDLSLDGEIIVDIISSLRFITSSQKALQ
jgi:hypothetical protein